ncbi:lipase (class 3) domain-containing protein [Ditylenchus destructor]|uniref:Lipase (Class 3) domain-containing protein n=1 Tax=Ditylenchus destructor TaxID=166010 RepID=A0AAD4QUN7_9BILA|nr:lipase (class 3) domain-containing protein [Ditylenchus destructor]
MSTNFLLLKLGMAAILWRIVFCEYIRTEAYRPQLAKMLSKMCCVAYGDDDESIQVNMIENGYHILQSTLPGNSMFYTFPNTGWFGASLRFFVAVDYHPWTVTEHPTSRKKMFIVFQGTALHLGQISEEVAKTVFQTFKSLFKANEDPLKLNAYFKEKFDIMWPSIEAILAQPQYKNYRVYFTGHSLGGAFASLAAYYTFTKKLRDRWLINVYTFGQPRVGGWEYARQFDEMAFYSSYRIVNQKDIIPHLPACRDSLWDKGYMDEELWLYPNACGRIKRDYNRSSKYFHHGREIWYKNGMDGDVNDFIQNTLFDYDCMLEDVEQRSAQIRLDKKIAKAKSEKIAKLMNSHIADQERMLGRKLQNHGRHFTNFV